MRILVLLLTGVCGVAAESVRIYSEFQRVDPAGRIVAADSGGRPREILSPAVGRHAYASFQLAVSVPPRKQFTMYLAQNPDNTFQAKLYREIHENGIPDRLEAVELPVHKVAEEGVEVYWLDLWAPLQTPAVRMRVEAQLYVDGHWTIYPMEVRVMKTVVPPIEDAGGELPPVSAPADAATYGPWKAAICGTKEKPARSEGPLTVRALIRRNAMQDVALARGRGSLGGDWREIWCGGAIPRGDAGPEWYLKLRGRLLKGDQ